MSISLVRPFRDPRFRRLVWVAVGITGWAGLVGLGVGLFAEQPPKAGFDLALVLDAGRRVAAGTSPYLAGAVSGGTSAEDLFFSYPPPIAQFASLVVGLTTPFVLLLSGLGASLGLGIVARGLAHAHGDRSGLDVVLPVLALAPFVYPFAIALLFGNVDAWFPFVYGAVLVATIDESGRWRTGAGIVLGLATLAKLYPGALFGWLAIRGLHTWIGGRYATRRAFPTEWITLIAAVATIALAVGGSLLVGGSGPWTDYVGVLRAGASAQLAVALNIGPASQLALLAGDPSLAARLAPVIGGGAVLVISFGAWFVPRTTLSLAIATAASLVLLPITWFHYPVAIVPFAAAAWVAARGTPSARPIGLVLIAALVGAGGTILAPVALWIAVALVLAGVALAPTSSVRRRLAS
ncbi:MAG: DUF2029 domain-containing protein [Chloroflexi bacterium]|nr:DUF2029 domain-containing protein [Chloroflexota bacterium]